MIAANKLQPPAQSDAALLLRRVSFDLTGLPPSYDDVIRSKTIQANSAYAAYVETLLASPAYGEHWARQWMGTSCRWRRAISIKPPMR